LAKIAENCDHNIDPWTETTTTHSEVLKRPSVITDEKVFADTPTNN
jgi:hypothetical protein